MLVHSQQGELDLLSIHSSSPQNYPFLLESVTQSKQSRYSILFAYPQETLRANHHDSDSFLDRFDQVFTQNHLDNLTQSEQYENSLKLPFRGGWFVYLAYELAQQIEPSLALPAYQLPDSLHHADDRNIPIAYAARIPAAIIIDHHIQQSYIVCEPIYEYIFEQIHIDLQTINTESDADITTKTKQNNDTNHIALEVLQEDPEQTYLDNIQTIRAYIQAGDVFQVNYSRAWTAITQNSAVATPQQLYYVLKQRNPAPFAALCVFDDWAIVSSSPERLVRVNNRIAETRPIAGTRPRSESTQADQALLDELINHPKERAEHIMLIDLERNDLGRICKAGSIEVDELMGLESYQHVHHIVSNIRGELRENILPGEVLKAVFPGGTITGCPKVRCMEIIAELEQTGRGAYTGSVGYINHNGDMDFNILIRSFTQIDDHLNFRTGAGIVFDSVAENELTETRHKAKGLLKVFET